MLPFKYRSDIDGLRAVAVLLVLLFHTEFGFSGGYIGVDVFFVISGFLITSLIIKNQQKEQFDLAMFWGRRIKRIVPAAFVVVVVTLLAGAWILLPEDYEQLAESTIYQQLMLANNFFYQNLNYFDGPSETKALLHTWSLAVEEQFYLVFPLLLILLRRYSDRMAASILAAFAILSFAYSHWATNNAPSAAFFLLPSRMWELLVGALLVYAPQPKSKSQHWQEIASLVGIAGILAAGLLFDAKTPFPGTAALVPCFATALIIYSSAHTQTKIGKLLSYKGIVFVGLISYSLYLWHWPILALLRYNTDQPLTTTLQCVALGLSFLCGWLSWKYVETPFRQGFQNIKLRRTLTITAACATVLIIVSVWIDHSKGLTWRLPAKVYRLIQGNEVPKRFRSNTEQVKTGDLPLLGSMDTSQQPIDFLVWGDSHALAIGTLMEDLATEHQLHGRIAARSAITPLVNTWRNGTRREASLWNDEVLNYIQQHKVQNVILISRWAVGIEEGNDGDLSSLISDKQTNSKSTSDARQVFQRGLHETLQRLSSSVQRVFLIEQVPYQTLNPEHQIVRAALNEEGIPLGVTLETHQQRQLHAHKIMMQVTAKFENVFLVDPTAHCFNEHNQSVIAVSHGVLYADNDHVSPLGAEVLFRPLLEPVIIEFK